MSGELGTSRRYIQQQYGDDSNLAARQSIYAYQRPKRDLHNRSLDLAELRGDESVVDVGCGNGRYLAALRARGHRGLPLRRGSLGGHAAHGASGDRWGSVARRATRSPCRSEATRSTSRSRCTCSTTYPIRRRRSPRSAGSFARTVLRSCSRTPSVISWSSTGCWTSARPPRSETFRSSGRERRSGVTRSKAARRCSKPSSPT